MKLNEIIHIVDGHLQLPVITLAKKKRRVVLIGMMHIAPLVFFAEVSRRLFEYERAGYQVLREAIDPEPNLGSSDARRMHKRLMFKMAKLVRRLRDLKIGSQTDRIPIQATWVSSDMATDQICREVPSLYNIDEMIRRIARFDYAIENPKRWVKQAVIEPILRGVEYEPHPVIVNRRDEIAATSIIRHAEHDNVATYWGAAHIPGISQRLLDAGFTVESTDLLPTFALSDYE